MDTSLLVALLILVPLVLGVVAWLAPSHLRNGTVITAASLSALLGVLLAIKGGSSTISLSGGSLMGVLATILDLGVIAAVLVIALRIKSFWIGVFAGLQGLLVLMAQLPHKAKEAAEVASKVTFLIDPLSIILVLIITIVGSLIVVYAIGYMKNHSHHAPATANSDGIFFLFLVGFLGAMNGLVLANDIRWLSIFWELTTLCSFFLIGHDGTEIAKANAKRALLINSFGGVALALAPVLAMWSGAGETLTSLRVLVNQNGIADRDGIIVLALLSLAALTKSAQMPFQSWLLGAMVAPTPVSALLHSATMVKAGSYLILRLAPMFQGTSLSHVLAFAGAFTFAVTIALAVSQSNAKKVLAYSTISNLGLIVACAGINTPIAYQAALLVLCFHAASKGLLFMCVGTIEQGIGSRDIEDMGGIMNKMPITTSITLIGMISMLAPPFGMLLSKWVAIESSAYSPEILILMVVGAALSVLVYVKWVGRIQTVSFHESYTPEVLPKTILWTLVSLASLVIIGGLLSIPFQYWCIQPIANTIFKTSVISVKTTVILFLALVLIPAVAVYFAYRITRKITRAKVRAPFLCGENVQDQEISYTFKGPADTNVTAWAGTFYLSSFFSEPKITQWGNLLASLIILAMFGGRH